MKKLFTVLFFVLFIQTISSAQLLSTSSSFGARYVMPVGDIADLYNSGWGITGTGYFNYSSSRYLSRRKLAHIKWSRNYYNWR